MTLSLPQYNKAAVAQQAAPHNGTTVMERYECYLSVLDKNDECVERCDGECGKDCFRQLLDGGCNC